MEFSKKWFWVAILIILLLIILSLWIYYSPLPEPVIDLSGLNNVSPPSSPGVVG